MGRSNRLMYRLVVADHRSPRDGKYLEMVGHYNPHRESPDHVFVVEDRIRYWLGRGAKCTEKARHLVAHAAPGLFASVREETQKKKELKRSKQKSEK